MKIILWPCYVSHWYTWSPRLPPSPQQPLHPPTPCRWYYEWRAGRKCSDWKIFEIFKTYNISNILFRLYGTLYSLYLSMMNQTNKNIKQTLLLMFVLNLKQARMSINWRMCVKLDTPAAWRHQLLKDNIQTVMLSIFSNSLFSNLLTISQFVYHDAPSPPRVRPPLPGHLAFLSLRGFYL